MFEKLNTEYMRANRARETCFNQWNISMWRWKTQHPRRLDFWTISTKRRRDTRIVGEQGNWREMERKKERARARARKKETEYRRGVKGETEKKRKKTIVALQGWPQCFDWTKQFRPRSVQRHLICWQTPNVNCFRESMLTCVTGWR